MSPKRSRYRSASSCSGPCFSRPIETTTRRMNTVSGVQFLLACSFFWRALSGTRAFKRAKADYMPLSRFAPAESSDRCRRRVLRPQPFEIVEFAHLGSEHVHDHIAGIDQHPVAIGQALDMHGLYPVFLPGVRHLLRDRADMPVGLAGGDDHVVGKCIFAPKVHGARFFRLHIVE